MRSTSRRNALKIAGAFVGGCAAGALPMRDGDAAQAATPVAPTHPWRYHRLSPDATANIAYQVYPQGSCMYAISRAIVGQLADQHGAPYSTFPIGMMRYGHGGTGGCGTLCGAINGAAAMFGLFVGDKKQCDQLTRSLVAWYEKTPIPQYKPPGAEALPKCYPRSPLCHLSVAAWCEKADKTPFSPERKERCRRLSADVARRAVELLNDALASPTPVFAKPLHAAGTCITCHHKGGEQADAISAMHCAPCHESHMKDHP